VARGFGWGITAEGLQAVAALILVGVTAYYAKMTRDLAKSTSDMAGAMVAGQERAEQIRRRERSERAVISGLDVLRSQRLGMGAGPIEQPLAQEVRHVLMWESPLVDDVQVRDRMRACSNAAFVVGWTEEAIAREGTDRPQASVRLQRLATATRESLEAYLTEQSLPEWADLPTETGAHAWVVRALNGAT
jgi:hypothetical protein